MMSELDTLKAELAAHGKTCPCAHKGMCEDREAWLIAEVKRIGGHYEPKPIDTAAILLPPEIDALTERLAENCHDVWAVGKLKEGITDHKDLIPYSKLAEGTKDYDRNTAMGTLKAIYALGYQVIKNEDYAPRYPWAATESDLRPSEKSQ